MVEAVEVETQKIQHFSQSFYTKIENNNKKTMNGFKKNLFKCLLKTCFWFLCSFKKS